MKILWLTTSSTFYHSSGHTYNSYNGIGWVAAQQSEIMKCPDVDLAIGFYTDSPSLPQKYIDGVKYYPICNHETKLNKLLKYYSKSIPDTYSKISAQLNSIIDDFKPDIIHIFGLECPMSDVIMYSDIPHVVHLQGLLIPYLRSFFPPGISIESVNKFGSFKREYLLRNGIKFAFKNIEYGARREKKLLAHLRYSMGRTDWDNNITKLYAPHSTYRHINEILRPEFYQESRYNPKKEINKITIVSTISSTMYKGLDLIINSCAVLKELGIEYEWHVIGVEGNTEYERIIKGSPIDSEQLEIIYEGICDAQKIVEILGRSDCYVHPSYIDNSPNSLCEAQMIGIPVIATNVGGVSSIIKHNEDGILIPANDPYTLVSSLNKLANDYEHRKRLSLNGRKNARARHDKKEIVDNIINYYSEILFSNGQKN